MSTVKFCVVGPKGSGKTTLCKLLAETDPDASYVPTEGVRIQEVERRVGMTPVTVQLWDCSGDFKYQNCFPAISLDADGLVLVHDAEEGDKEAELERWHEVFGERAAAELDANRCVAVCTRRGVGGASAEPTLPGKLATFPRATLDLGGDARASAAKVAEVLDKILATVVAMKREMEENSVLG